MRNLVSLAVLLGLCVAVPANIACAEPISIKVSCQNNITDHPGQALSTFKKVVEEKSKGKYKVDLYYSNSLGACDTVVQGIQFGTIHFGFETTSNLSQFDSRLGITDCPYLFLTKEDMDRVINSEFGRTHILNILEKKGIKIYSIIPSSYRPMATIEYWRTLEDLKGKKFRSTANKIHMGIISSLGMTPSPLPPSEMVPAIQQHVVDGSDTDVTGLISYRFCDVVKHVLLADYSVVAFAFFGNQKWYDKLSDEDKAVFDAASDAFYADLKKRYETATEETYKELREKYNIVITQLDDKEKARWIERTKPVYDLLNPEQKELVEQIRVELEKK
ncbi:TRAP transporter substrate-binding protein [Mailhella massiliensis]|uniref:TRAP transporter substrate-binding protein n=1 Tax=Mailhella massiliensis TaxID=1903261 RepID=A0A921AVK4_9BACT|nr:TRAP transporter substrate-binding protein [Mailhella massiliensis]HJD96700.1 TRAP transporter substrate-binding protein [Mailhella massiliensis]